jgi:hypothetical protein
VITDATNFAFPQDACAQEKHEASLGPVLSLSSLARLASSTCDAVGVHALQILSEYNVAEPAQFCSY